MTMHLPFGGVSVAIEARDRASTYCLLFVAAEIANGMTTPTSVSDNQESGSSINFDSYVV